jgi:hypothetical protein
MLGRRTATVRLPPRGGATSNASRCGRHLLMRDKLCVGSQVGSVDSIATIERLIALL